MVESTKTSDSPFAFFELGQVIPHGLLHAGCCENLELLCGPINVYNTYFTIFLKTNQSVSNNRFRLETFTANVHWCFSSSCCFLIGFLVAECSCPSPLLFVGQSQSGLGSGQVPHTSWMRPYPCCTPDWTGLCEQVQRDAYKEVLMLSCPKLALSHVLKSLSPSSSPCM